MTTTNSMSTCSPMQSAPSAGSKRQTRRWTQEEHAKFLRGLEMFPHGPWSRIAALVGTRTTRQTMTHAQKYRERMVRRANEVHAMWGAHGAQASYALLQETVRALPPYTPKSDASNQLSSSDEELMEEIGINGMAAELDELDMRILMSLVSPETEDNAVTGHVEPMTAAESHQLDQTIWSFLAEVPMDLTQLGDEL